MKSCPLEDLGLAQATRDFYLPSVYRPLLRQWELYGLLRQDSCAIYLDPYVVLIRSKHDLPYPELSDAVRD